jgi:hypothetical protein
MDVPVLCWVLTINKPISEAVSILSFFKLNLKLTAITGVHAFAQIGSGGVAGCSSGTEVF